MKHPSYTFVIWCVERKTCSMILQYFLWLSTNKSWLQSVSQQDFFVFLAFVRIFDVPVFCTLFTMLVNRNSGTSTVTSHDVAGYIDVWKVLVFQKEMVPERSCIIFTCSSLTEQLDGMETFIHFRCVSPQKWAPVATDHFLIRPPSPAGEKWHLVARPWPRIQMATVRQIALVSDKVRHCKNMGFAIAHTHIHRRTSRWGGRRSCFCTLFLFQFSWDNPKQWCCKGQRSSKRTMRVGGGRWAGLQDGGGLSLLWPTSSVFKSRWALCSFRLSI